MTNGAVVYRDAERMAIVTGLRTPSRNPKTGAMAQTWILPTAHDPLTAVRTGVDSVVCGDCDGRPGNSGWCYVVVAHAPNSVWRTYHKVPVTPQALDVPQHGTDWPRPTNKGLPIRLGAYGDPATLPIETLDRLTLHRRHTGYTHQWRKVEGEYAAYLMASVETPEQRDNAKDLGYRTFRVVPSADAIAPTEIHCPADKTPGKVTCAACGLCNGLQSATAKDVAVVAHGATGQPQKLYQIEGYGARD